MHDAADIAALHDLHRRNCHDLSGTVFWRKPDTTGWLLLCALGLVGSLGHYILTKAFQYAPASTLQPFHYIVQLWATVIGYTVFGDLPDLWTVLGAAVIASSGLYAFYREKQADT